MPARAAAAGISMGSDIANTLINQAFAEHNRKRNFYWNEKAADNADQRQRKQYQDLYSPQAMMDQYAAAGLSQSMMMSGGQSATGSSTAQGNMSAGVQGAYPTAKVFDPMIMAELSLKKAQERNLDEDTVSKELANEIEKLKNTQFEEEYEFLNGFNSQGWWKNGVPGSIYDIVHEAKSFDVFKNVLYKELNDNAWTYLNMPKGDEMLRNVYKSIKEFDNEVKVLENSTENAELMLKITKLLNNDDFATQSADTQKTELKKAIEDAKLTGRERQAYNNLLDKMGENTWTDIAIVLLSLIGKYSHANLNLGSSHSKSIVHKD